MIPGGVWTREEFLQGIQARWPNARVATTLADDPMIAEALIPVDNRRRELGVALAKLGFAVFLDPADPDSAAGFIDWYLTQIPSFDPEVRLITEDFETSMPLTPDTTSEDILRFLGNPA